MTGFYKKCNTGLKWVTPIAKWQFEVYNKDTKTFIVPLTLLLASFNKQLHRENVQYKAFNKKSLRK